MMGIQLNKILSVLSVLILISCKGNRQEKNQSQKSNNKEPFHEQIDFLDKKYFEKYELIIDESNFSVGHRIEVYVIKDSILKLKIK